MPPEDYKQEFEVGDLLVTTVLEPDGDYSAYFSARPGAVVGIVNLPHSGGHKTSSSAITDGVTTAITREWHEVTTIGDQVVSVRQSLTSERWEYRVRDSVSNEISRANYLTRKDAVLAGMVAAARAN